MNAQRNQSLNHLQRRVSASEGSPLAIHCAWTLANLLGINDFEDPNPFGFDSTEDCLRESEALGYREGLTGTVPFWFAGTPLATAWNAGADFRCECEMYRGGTQEEWDALSPEEQSASCDSFHDLCASGVGERHHFYDLLMKKWMVGYVGH
ncbi:hypothetical protein A8H39_01105 [Paraburkholderia fungorum]|uniref:hypothetical protein n=1 Tax=Paraburkholderia fungorum TaxID=134537 RepID=UPI0004847101|nr:hypothetical protein [Paraburkholderia fungorum]PNE59776.1 hypothetical protein A8H39_01105 [Paraburkholderia fungorum]